MKLILLSAQYFLMDEITIAARELNWELHRCPTKNFSEFVKKVNSIKPDFILTINHIGLTQEILDLNIPVKSWFIDNPMICKMLEPTNNMKVFCFERETIPWLSLLGYNPEYLPLGSSYNIKMVNESLMNRFKCDLSFVGNSWWYSANVKWKQPNAEVLLARETLAKRKLLVEELIPMGLKLYGDRYWKLLIPDIKIKYLNQLFETPSLFAASKINVNSTAAQMPTALNERVWNAPCVNGFLITDNQADVSLFFEPNEMITYESIEHLKELIDFYSKHERERNEIICRGRAKIEGEHMLTHRLLKIAK
jgi:spore maturation protein CgeB